MARQDLSAFTSENKSSISPSMISRISGYRTISRDPDRKALLSKKYNRQVRRRCRKRVTRRTRKKRQWEERRRDEWGGGRGEGGGRVSASARSSVDDCTTFRGYGREVSWRVLRNGDRDDSLVPYRTPLSFSLSLSLSLSQSKLGKNKNAAPFTTRARFLISSRVVRLDERGGWCRSKKRCCGAHRDPHCAR